MGGIARRASKINSIRRSEGSVIVVDAGGFSPPFGEQEVMKFDTMLVSFLQMEYDVLSVAEPEIRMQIAAGDAWDKLRALRIPLATLNVKHRGRKVAEKPLIISRGGVKVAFIALVVQEESSREAWTVIDPERLVDDAVTYGRENADFVVGMLWGKSDKVQSFVERHKGMDVVIPAAETGELFEPAWINGSMVFSAGSQGKYLGRIDASLKEGKWRFEGRPETLGKHVPEDPLLSGTYAGYQEKVTAMAQDREENMVKLLRDKYPPKPLATSCRSCHEEIHEKWEKTRHAGAILSLLKKNEHRNPECLPCHVVGYLQGGFISLDRTGEYAGVQCVSCHGDMEGHADYHSGLVKQEKNSPVEVGEDVCLQCHTPQNDHDFVFERDKKLVH
jgi:hypothetical protein